eukprot:1172330-Prorocentrum_minimum.AAC.1
MRVVQHTRGTNVQNASSQRSLQGIRRAISAGVQKGVRGPEGGRGGTLNPRMTVSPHKRPNNRWQHSCMHAECTERQGPVDSSSKKVST